jgi:serine/threonine protein kinase
VCVSCKLTSLLSLLLLLQTLLPLHRIQVIIPLLKVLTHLHGLGIIHRDVKPENIFFDGTGSLVLGDFGLAIRAPDRATSRVGTLDYMAPEVRLLVFCACR